MMGSCKSIILKFKENDESNGTVLNGVGVWPWESGDSRSQHLTELAMVVVVTKA